MPTCPPIRGAVTESHTHVIMSVSQRVEHWAQEGPRGACVWGQHVPGQRVCGDSVCVRGQRVWEQLWTFQLREGPSQLTVLSKSMKKT